MRYFTKRIKWPSNCVEMSDICVIPVRMTEAWLLIDEKAIRIAAGNRNGTEILEIPKLHELESLPDPKKLLYELIISEAVLHGQFAINCTTMSYFTDLYSSI